MEEIWRPVVGFEGLYEVSSYGRVKSLNYNKTGGGYRYRDYVNRDYLGCFGRIFIRRK